LRTQDNGLGYRVTMTYQPAAKLAAADAAAGAPWSSTPPAPAPVLVATTETDGAEWKRTTQYHPRDGWHDPKRGELRGFAEHTHTRDGDDYSRTTITTRRYDLGRHEEALGLQLLEDMTSDPDGALVREVHTLTVEPWPPASMRRGGPPRTLFTWKAAPRTWAPACASNGTTTTPATSSKSAPWAASIKNPGPTSPATSASPRPSTPSRSTPTARATSPPKLW
jgi:hypothetical protein